MPALQANGIILAVQIYMTNITKNKRLWAGVSPWIFIGAVAVLFPIFAFMTIENIDHQKENSTRLLKEKGAALIRSFEAGTRTGMMGEYWRDFQLRKLLTETAQQPDIVYLLVTDVNGTIIAHDDRKHIGKIHGKELNLDTISRMKEIQWRLITTPDSQKIFEVFRRFSPTGGPGGKHRGRMMIFQERFMQHMNMRERNASTPHIIFVGLDMSTIEAARKADTRHTIIMGLILLLIGFAGIILLFLAQSYRATKTSLSRIKAFSDNLVENMPIGLLAIDNKGKIASFNQVAESILCLSADKVVGEDANKYLPQTLLEPIDNIDIDKQVVEKEIECSMTDGKVIPLEVGASKLSDENGTFLGHIMLFKDLTEIQNLRREVARSQRLASVGSLAAGVAHEIRNPLSSIKGFVTYFKERYQDNSDDQQTANIMIQEVDRVNRVVGQLLEFARPINISQKPTSMKTLIENSLKLIERQATEKNIKIQTALSPETNEVYLDPDKINQLLLNLYLNAIESMDDEGSLSVTQTIDEDNKWIEIKISDTGVGISKEDLAHIFDPYFTTKSTGTGIGLSVVHNIIEAHNGKINVDSRLGDGTTLTILLPYSAKK